ncbi:MAG: SDR family oxidoreductase [Chloroflexota bacterium]
MEHRRILITGASGLLGLSTALEACDEHTVIGQVNSRTLNTTQFQTVPADLLAPGAVQRLLDRAQPDWVIHCAALANLEACEADPARARELNTEVPRLLAQHVARGGARLLHVSTDAVFDGLRGGYTEQDAPNPLSVYARTKLDGERAVAQADPSAIIARVNLFGWSASGKRSLAEFFFNNLSAGRPVKGFTDVYFCPLLVNHAGQLFLQMLEHRLRGLYHVVSADCLSKYDFGLAIARRFGLDETLIAPASVLDGGLTAARSPKLTLSIHKLLTDLSQPVPSFLHGLERFYTLYQQGYPQKLQAF